MSRGLLKKKIPDETSSPLSGGDPSDSSPGIGITAIARKVQAAMIPRRLPSVEGLDMALLCIPSSTVGGAIFDCMELSQDLLAVIVFQVAGHSVSSTLVNALAKVLFYNHIRAVRSPRAVIERVTAEIHRDIGPELKIAAFAGYLDLHDNSLTCSNTGNIRQVLCNGEKHSITHLESKQPFAEIFDSGFSGERTIQLNPGDWLFLFTSGIEELLCDVNQGKSPGAFDQILLTEIRDAAPPKFIERIRTRCEDRANLENLRDDLSLIALEVLTESRRNRIKEKLGFSAGEPVYIETISCFEETDHAAATVLRTMDSLGYPDEVIRKMKVSLTELLVNAIQHGNGKDYAKKVVIGHMVTSEKTTVSIMDEGAGFNPKAVPDPTLPGNLGKDCGRGLYIVFRYVDKMEHNDAGNRIMITKYHPYV